MLGDQDRDLQFHNSMKNCRRLEEPDSSLLFFFSPYELMDNHGPTTRAWNLEIYVMNGLTLLTTYLAFDGHSMIFVTLTSSFIFTLGYMA